MTTLPVDSLSIAAAQVAPVAGNVGANVASFVALIREAAAQDVALVVFPELALIGYDLGQLGAPDVWVTNDDTRLSPLHDVCVETGVTAIAGAAYLDPGGVPRLASLVFLPDGSRETAYKVHVHGTENDHFVAGAYPPTTIEVRGWKVALAICFDAAIPTHAIAAADEGADLYVTSAMYTTSEIRRLDLHFASRAMDHRMFSLLANLTGTGPGWESCGRSGTWGPDGDVRVTVDTEPGLVIDRLPYADLLAFRPQRISSAVS